MIKIRITFIDDEPGNKEVEEFIAKLDEKNIISKSKVYKGRGGSNYSNIYLDHEKRV